MHMHHSSMLTSSCYVAATTNNDCLQALPASVFAPCCRGDVCAAAAVHAFVALAVLSQWFCSCFAAVCACAASCICLVWAAVCAVQRWAHNALHFKLLSSAAAQTACILSRLACHLHKATA
jgi:hypothetical protein